MNAFFVALLALSLFVTPIPAASASCSGQPIPADWALLGQSSQGAWYFLIDAGDKVGIIRWTEGSGNDYEMVLVRNAPSERSPVAFLRVNFADGESMLLVVFRCNGELAYTISMIPNIDTGPTNSVLTA